MDFDNADIPQQHSRINTRFELPDDELDNDNSKARLYERSRIKGLAGEFCMMWLTGPFWVITHFENFKKKYFKYLRLKCLRLRQT